MATYHVTKTRIDEDLRSTFREENGIRGAWVYTVDGGDPLSRRDFFSWLHGMGVRRVRWESVAETPWSPEAYYADVEGKGRRPRP